ncbi:hypothetical protein CRE_16387 [Caenorhabditis remanei]|uniref:RNA-directed DNA polymerase n=1 Tax=Caenorhabditis remanei TaxID=31234 RepID=E3NC52_CAERE|nr:hypothetical protein CRE_16387 [Caenorhabditis remanei]
MDNNPTFKDIKVATEAMLLIMPKFSGENQNEFFSNWATKFTREANNLTLGKKLAALVLPRMLTGKANDKYLSLEEGDKTDVKTALERLAPLLRSTESRNKAMNFLADPKKKESESFYSFGKRITEQVNLAYPKALLTEKEDISINRFIQGVPSELRTKLKEGNEFDTLTEAVDRAEKLDEILKEDNRETVNLIQRMSDSEKDMRLERLEKQVEKLQLENRKLSERKVTFGNRPSSYPNRNRSNFPNQGGNYQNNFRNRNGNNGNSAQNYGRNQSQSERSRPPGWQINRAPRTTGLNFLMIVAMITVVIQAVSGQMQICPNSKSGEYFASPTISSCKLDKEEKVLKTNVQIFTEYGASKKLKAHRCSRTDYDFCFEQQFFKDTKVFTQNMKSSPMKKDECEEAIARHTVNNITLVSKGNNIFQTPTEDGMWFSLSSMNCEQRHLYTLEKGEVATSDGHSILTSLGDASGCDAQSGNCEIIDSRLVWDTEGVKDFCKYSFVQNTTAYITKSKVALPDLQMALSIEQNQAEKGSLCIPNLKLTLNNGFILSIDTKSQVLEELIEEVVDRKNRVKRTLSNPLIKRLFGENATHENYPYFSVDPIFDPRIIEEMRRFGVTYAQIRHQWETYELPNKQTATLRAIREAEYRHQMIRQLRQNPADEHTPARIRQLEEPTHQFDEMLNEEFGYYRILSAEEKQKRTWHGSGSQTTRTPLLREKAGEDYVRRIAEQERITSEAKGNAQLNGRVQFASNQITEANYNEFDKIYQKICELQNNQIEITKTLLAIDPTLGMRTLLMREDIVARRSGAVYIVTQCRNVTVDKIHLDHRVNGTCYRDTPVTLKNQTWFIAPGMTRDLIKESEIIPCEEVILGVYQNEKGEWYSHNGIATVRKIGIQFSMKPERQNLTLSAPPAFLNLENVENPSTYLIAHLNTIIMLRDNQANLARSLEEGGLKTPKIDGVIKSAARGISIVASEIESSIEKGKQVVKEAIISFIKSVVVPIIIVIAVVGIMYILLKIYFMKKATGSALMQFAKLARRAPPNVRTLMRRMRPEINNIVLNDDDDDDEVTELETFNRRHAPSLISMPNVNSIMTVGGKTYLPYVPIHLNGKPAVSLLDSGASVSLIAERVINQLRLKDKVTSTDCSARVANGSTMKFKGKVQIIISIGKTSVTHTFLVVQNEQAPAPCLLGTDFILRMNLLEKEVSINIPKRYVKIGEERVKLLDPSELGHEDDRKITVVCANDEKIPPRSYAIISGKIPGVLQEQDEFIISDTDRETQEIYSVSSVLTKMDTDGNVVVRIMNPGNSELVLRKGSTIAEAEILRETDIIQQPSVNTIQENFPKLKSKEEEAQILLRKIDLNESKLSKAAKIQIRKLICKYPDAFVGSDGRIGKFKGVTTHHIELVDDHTIPQARPYRLNPEQKDKLEKELRKMRDNDLIEESSSPYTSPLLMIPKSNGEIRIVIDYRKLNLITRPRTYIMPNTLDITEEASKGRIFSVFDICQGFHHVKMHQAHKERTAFCCHLGVFQYKYMPMGLRGSPDTFQRAMSEVQQKFSGSMIIYVDDIVLVSETEQQHLEDLEEFFKLMIQMGLKLKAEKSQIGRSKITFLGFDIENNTIQPNGEKTKSIREFPVPKTVTEIRQFLGMASYFRRFIPGFATIVSPLNNLLRKETEFVWKKEQQDAFENVKEKLISPPILTTPNNTGIFELHTDASKVGIAAVLMQRQDGELKVIAYGSRPTTPVESRYPAIELESLAISWGLTVYKPYIFGKKVIVITDHLPLKSLLHRKEKTMSGRLMRHEAIIQQFDVEIRYRPGKENHVADTLSRQRDENGNSEEISVIQSSEESKEKPSWTFATWKKIQKESENIQKIMEILSSERIDEAALKIKSKYLLINEMVHQRPAHKSEAPPVLLEGGTKLISKLIMDIHQMENHGGPEKTRASISKFAVWRNMRMEIFHVITTCPKCQRRKHIPQYRSSVPMGRWEIPGQPFQRIHMDVIGPFPETRDGNKYIIAAIDSFSRFAIAKATADQKAPTTLKFLIENIVGVHGIPSQIVTDQGRNFTSNMFAEIGRLLEVEHILTPAYHHETNGVIERFNRTLEEMLTCSAKQPENFSDWDRKLPIVMQSYNARHHSAIDMPPERMIFGRSTSSPCHIYIESLVPQYHDEKDYADSIAEIIKHCYEKANFVIENQQKRDKISYDKRHKVRDTDFQIGDQVIIRDTTAGKLQYQFSPPATVLKTTETTVTIRTIKNKIETVHKDRVKRYFTEESAQQAARMELSQEGQAESTQKGQAELTQRGQAEPIKGGRQAGQGHRQQGNKDKDGERKMEKKKWTRRNATNNPDDSTTHQQPNNTVPNAITKRAARDATTTATVNPRTSRRIRGLPPA